MIVISFFASGLLTVAIAVAVLIAGKLLVRWLERLDTTRERPFRDTVRSVQAMIVGVVLFFWLFISSSPGFGGCWNMCSAHEKTPGELSSAGCFRIAAGITESA